MENAKIAAGPHENKITNFYLPNAGSAGTITEQKTFVTDTTVFKLLVFFSHKESGHPYSEAEIKANANRKYVESFDRTPTVEGKWFTRHDAAYEKLRTFYRQYNHVIMRSMLFVNDFDAKKQYKIGDFYRNKDLNRFIPPKFFTDLDSKQCFYDGLNGSPLRTYPLIQRTITYTERFIMLK